MTDEQKQKMREGRAAAKLARQQAQPVVDLAPGKDRNEQRAINAESLAQQIDQNNEVGAVDPAKLARKDNEIQRHIRPRRDRSSGVPIKGAQPDKEYAWLTMAGPHGEAARANIRHMNAEAKEWGYKAVEGDNPAGEEFKGNDGMAGTSGRAVGDVFLAEIPKERYETMLEEDRDRRERQGIVEDRSVVYAQERLGAHVMHNFADDRDDFMKARIDPSLRSPVTMTRSPAMATTHFTEGDIRRGSLKGPNGQSLPPGFERRI